VICTDGTTLLGSDDKGAVAEIVELAQRLLEDPSKPHPTLKLALVPDEEIGHGARLLDIEKTGCRWGYTVDGERVGKLNYECFNASMWDVTAHGLNVHPGIAKNVMVNANRIIEEFDMLLPAEERPQYTNGYEGFFHQMSIAGDVNRCTARYIVRDHDAEKFAEREKLMHSAASYINARYGKEVMTLTCNEQYRNMAEVIRQEGGQCLIDNALAAIREAGVEPEVMPIRGGTDGAQLTYRGLLCPNITNGGLNHHSIKELQSVQSMEKTVEILEHLVARFAVPQKD
jgi:tripeptide aminopeptidase